MFSIGCFDLKSLKLGYYVCFFIFQMGQKNGAIKFVMKKPCLFGEQIMLVNHDPSLGGLDPKMSFLFNGLVIVCKDMGHI